MKAIGGYFELELSYQENQSYHEKAIALNSGRNALKLLLKERDVKYLYLPYYLCEAILEPLEDLNIQYEYYQLDKNLELKNPEKISADSFLLYINYFGLKGRYLHQLYRSFDNLIVDNSQAFYDRPPKELDTFYSPRKFFGVPDGGYVYGPDVEKNFEKDIVYDRCEHLLIRSDVEAEVGYKIYQENEEKFVNRPIKGMSTLTRRLLSNISYEEIKKQRISNYSILHRKLGNINVLKELADSVHICPLVYPFINNKIKRKQLIDHSIYVPQYWPNIIDHLPSDGRIEFDLAQNLIPLPIDQRYTEKEMNSIVDVIKQYV